MHHTTFSQKLKKHKALLFALLGIVCVFSIPVPAPIVSFEEHSDDTKGIHISKNKPFAITIDNIPQNTSAVVFWTGGTSSIPLGANIEIIVDQKPPLHIEFNNTLAEERTLTVPLPRSHDSSVRIEIKTPTISEKTPLVLHTRQEDTKNLAYTLYEKKPLIVSLLTTLTSHDSTGDDIEYVWNEGAAVAKGGNPYAKAATDLHKNGKYATYFPLSYIASGAVHALGFTSFEDWLQIVRPSILAFQLLTALLVLLFLYSKNKLFLGVFAFFLILFHRFTLYPARIYQIDFPAIFFLLLGIMLLPTKSKIGYLLLGISLAIKQMSIIIIPLFVLREYMQHRSIQKLSISIAILLLVPAVSFLPFLITNPQGVVNSIAFSTHRSSGGDFSTPDIATFLGLTDSLPRLIMYGLMAIIYVAFWKKEIPLFGASLAIFTIFIGFNPVLFFQYLAWIIPFIPLALAETNRK